MLIIVDLGFSAASQKYHNITSLIFSLLTSLAVTIRYSEVQKCLQSDRKPFQQMPLEF